MNKPASPVCLLFLLFGACADEQVVTFGAPRRVPVDQRPMEWDLPALQRLHVRAMPSAKPPAGSGVAAGSTAVVANTPAGWEQLPAQPGRFKDAVWGIKGDSESTCYLTKGVGGGVAFNLNRWYVQQFGQPEPPAAASLPEIRFANRPGRLVEHVGKFNGKEGWAAMIAFYNEGDRVTSLKFTGPSEVVQNNRKQFLSLAKSIRFRTGGAKASAPPIEPGQEMPQGHVPIGPGNGAAPADVPSPFTASVPDGWEAKGGRRILHHTFGQKSEVYVSELGGSLRQSLDIWRTEMGMGPMSDTDFESLPQALFLGDDAILMDLSGQFRGMTGATIADARLLVAARVDGATITFCKLVGPKSEVDSQRDAFVRFCGSIRRKP